MTDKNAISSQRRKILKNALNEFAALFYLRACKTSVLISIIVSIVFLFLDDKVFILEIPDFVKENIYLIF